MRCLVRFARSRSTPASAYVAELARLLETMRAGRKGGYSITARSAACARVARGGILARRHDETPRPAPAPGRARSTDGVAIRRDAATEGVVSARFRRERQEPGKTRPRAARGGAAQARRPRRRAR